MVNEPLSHNEKHLLEYGIDYTVSILEEQDTGGILTLLTSIPPEAEQFVIQRVTPKTQEIQLHNGARLAAELIEIMGDKATMQIQEIADQIIPSVMEITEEVIPRVQEIANQIDSEAQLRRQGDADTLITAKSYTNMQVNYEAQARINYDNELMQKMASVKDQLDNSILLINYIIDFIISIHGPMSGAFLLAVEGEFYLVTENDDCLVVA